MFCSKCGHKFIEENDAFCPSCGSARAVALTALARPKGKSKYLIIIGACVTFIIAAVVVFVFFFDNSFADNQHGVHNTVNPNQGAIAFTMGATSYWNDSLPNIWHYGFHFLELIYYIRPDNSLWVYSARPLISSEMMLGAGASQLARDEFYADMLQRYGLARDQHLHEMVLPNVSYVTSNGQAVFALQTDGTLWAWGHPARGQLGIGEMDDWVYQPARVMDNIASVHATYNFSAYAIDRSGTLWGWGGPIIGALGDGSVGGEIWSPVPIMQNVHSFAAGAAHNFIITNDNQLFAWGFNAFGQLGNGTTEDRYVPALIMDNVRYVGVADTSNARQFALSRASANHSFAITNDNTLWTWGSNEGQSPTPIMQNVSYASSVFMPVTGTLSNFAFMQDGSMWAWGENKFTELGTGRTSDGSTPIKIMPDAKSIWQVMGQTFALDSSGNVWHSLSQWSLVDMTTHHEPFMPDFHTAPFLYIEPTSQLFLRAGGSLWMFDKMILPPGSVRTIE
ncbi:MAG: hypothetical protein FWE34_05385 [Defluviitaleaceae bacterium]|nr:hypothetical protein [Defluviitaleaceae bacterium]